MQPRNTKTKQKENSYGFSFRAFVNCICLGAAFIFGSATSTKAAANGAIRGRVELRRTPPAITRRRASPRSAPSRRQSLDRSRSVVYWKRRRALFEANRAGGPCWISAASIRPHLLAITVRHDGGFSNSAPFYHNVFSLSKIALRSGPLCGRRIEVDPLRSRASSACSATFTRT